MIDWRRRTAAFLVCMLPLLCVGQVRHSPSAPAVNPRPLTVFGVEPPDHRTAPASLRRLEPALRGIAALSPGATAAALHNLNPALRVRLAAPATTPEVLVDVSAQDPAAALRALQALGLRESAHASNLIGGWLPVSALAQVAALSGVNQVRASMPRTRASAGPVALQGDFVQGTSALRSQYPTLTGKGITVGVLSDSYNCYAYYATHAPSARGNGYNGYATNGFTATAAMDVSSGALPAGINVVAEADCADYGAPQQLPFTDEGRAMAQIVHAVAPDAVILFHTAANSEADFAAGIGALQRLGATVIVDDVGYPDEPFFQDGVLAQAVDAAAAQGVAYFSSAGNDWRNSYENSAPSFIAQGGRQLLNFDTSGASTATTLPISIPAVAPGQFVLLSVQWDQPYVTGAPGSPGAANTLNFCIESATPGTDYVAQQTGAAQIVTYPVCTGPNSIGADPFLILAVGNPANATAPTAPASLTLSIELVSGVAPGRVKFLLGDNGLGASIDTFATFSSTIQGHPSATGAAAIGAALYFHTPACGTAPAILERYSSYGDARILFSANGVALATPELRSKPDLTGPDAINDTFLGFQLANSSSNLEPWNGSGLFPTAITQCQNNPQYPNFFGTSAAAPHVASAAALLWQSNPALSATQIIAALKQTALPMSEGAQGAGAGFLQADAALTVLPVGAPQLSISPTQVTVGTAATLSWASYGTSSCMASGNWGGSEPTSGTLTVTPDSAGTLSYSLACSGASGTGTSSQVTLMVQSSAGHHGGGGALDEFSLTLLLGVLLGLVRLRALK